MANIIKLESSIPTIEKKKKVAAYARISVQSERMNHSLSSQISYYNTLIQNNPKWEFAGVYADNGISGTSVAKREEFKRMIDDARKGKIDIILTKSIQRFARNTLDLLNIVRELKELGIEVRFEKEHINSLSGDGELMLTILASFAQEESRSISENAKWAIKKRFEKGIPNGRFRVIGYDWVGDKLVVNENEAKIVKKIYQNFLDGKSRLETERELNSSGITTKAGYKWCDSNIKVVLTNITYTGDLLLQKEYIEDPITKKRKKNKGELTQYYVENHHEPIIDKETFNYIQSEMKRRRELGPFANKSLNTSCFTSKIKCEICGRNYVRSTRNNRAKHSNLGEKVSYWVCTSKKEKGCTCKSKDINEILLKRECAKVLKIQEFDENLFKEKVEKIIVKNGNILEFYFKDGKVISQHWINTLKKESWTDEYKKIVMERRRKRNAKGDNNTSKH